MKSSENCAHNFCLLFYHLRYFKYNVSVCFEVTTENTKTFIKQKHFPQKNCRHGFVQ